MSSFRFRKKTEYGIMMMAILTSAGEGAIVPVSRLQEHGLPRSFMVAIARELIRAKLITAKEGRGGGYSLAKRADQVTLQDIVVAIEGEVATVACLLHGAKRCPLADSCPQRTMMSELTEELGQVLSRHSLSRFAKLS